MFAPQNYPQTSDLGHSCHLRHQTESTTSLREDKSLAFIMGPAGHKGRMHKGGGTLWLVRPWHRQQQEPTAAGQASLAAFPGRAPALHGIDDLVVHDRAVGTVQGHTHRLRPRRPAAGTLFLHILNVDRVHGFAGTLAL